MAEKGLPIIDTDEIAHQLLAKDPKIQKEIKAAFGTTDRSQLRDIIFGDLQKRTKIEQILHPPILAEVRLRVAEFRKKTPLPKAVIVVIPLLYETSGQDHVDQVLVVLCKEELQLQRLMLRDGTRKDLAKQMIAAQMPNDEKARRAQFVIRNDGDKAALLKAVDDLIPKLTF